MNTSASSGTRTFNLQICGPFFAAKLAPNFAATDNVTPMLHSKVIYTDLGYGKCTVFVGSHNWTSNGLNGVNFEASVGVECEVDDQFAVDVREHLDNVRTNAFPSM